MLRKIQLGLTPICLVISPFVITLRAKKIRNSWLRAAKLTNMRIAQTLIQIQKAFLFLLLCFLCQSELVAQCPTIQAIMVDACGTEQDNEFIIINSGGGFNVSDLQIDYDINNNIIGPENNDVNIGASPVQAGTPGMISGCSNVIPAGPGTMIPPNSYVVFQTSTAVSTSYDFSAVCGTQQCVYVIRSTCARSAGAFSNSGTGTRVTGLSINGGCNATTVPCSQAGTAPISFHRVLMETVVAVPRLFRLAIHPSPRQFPESPPISARPQHPLRSQPRKVELRERGLVRVFLTTCSTLQD